MPGLVGDAARGLTGWLSCLPNLLVPFGLKVCALSALGTVLGAVLTSWLTVAGVMLRALGMLWSFGLGGLVVLLWCCIGTECTHVRSQPFGVTARWVRFSRFGAVLRY